MDEVLKPDFLNGITEALASQLQREASIGTSSGSSRKRTDESSAAILNSTLSSHGRGPAPLPTRPERRKVSREGHSTDASGRRNEGPARPDIYELPPDPTPSSSTPPSAQLGTQDPAEQHVKPRRSTRVKEQLHGREQGQGQEERTREAQRGPTAEELPRKRGRGRPPKSSGVPESSSKRHKSTPADTNPTWPSGIQTSRSQDTGSYVEDTPNSAASSRKTSKQTSNKSPQTASRTLSQMRKTKSHAREESVKGYNGEASGTPARDVSDDSHNDDEFHSDPNALDGLVGDLKEIWVDKKEQGVKRIRRQRKKYDLEIRNESSKLLVRRCRDLADDLKSPTKTSTKPTESEGKRLCETIASLGNDVYHFNLEKKDETRNHLFQDLYAYIFPRLLHTLCRIVNFYVQSFSQDTSQATIPALHLQTIVDFTAAIVKLGERARSSKVKVDSALFIVRPTRNYILAPIGSFHESLAKVLWKQAVQEENEQAWLIERTRIEKAELRRQKEAEEEAPRKASSNDWRLLHIIRREMEPDFRLWSHLYFIPPPSCQIKVIRDVDANGYPFDRWDLFGHRRTHHKRGSAELIQEPLDIEWDDEECLALMESLAKYAKRGYSK